jgi:hypothetical protein
MTRDDHHGQGVDSEPVLRAEVNNIPVVRNAVAVITAALAPTAMLVRPLPCAALLPNHSMFVARLNVPRVVLDRMNHSYVVAWLYMPSSRLRVISALGAMLLSRMLAFRVRFAGLGMPFARLLTFRLFFVPVPLVPLVFALAIGRNSGSKK